MHTRLAPSFLIVLVSVLVAFGFVLMDGLGAVVAEADAVRPRSPEIEVVDYDLGPNGFDGAGFHALGADGWPTKKLTPLEIAGRVYATRQLAGNRLLLVSIAHGLWWTCSDRAAYRAYEKAFAESSSSDVTVREHASRFGDRSQLSSKDERAGTTR